MKKVTSLSAARVPATSIVVGDQVAVHGLTYFDVEWVRTWEDGSVWMAGLRNNGFPHTSSLSSGAMVSKVFDLVEEEDET